MSAENEDSLPNSHERLLEEAVEAVCLAQPA